MEGDYKNNDKMMKWLFLLVVSSLAALLSCTTGENIETPEAVGEGLEAFSAAERKQANTAASEPYLSSFEKEVFLYLNLVRLNPSLFAKTFVQGYEGAPGYAKGYAFDERKASLLEQLKHMQPLEVIKPNKELFDLAECFATAHGKKGLVGHDRTGTGCEKGYHAECCGYGKYDSGLYSILELLVDSGEGNEALGHRRILLGDYKYMGVAQRNHTRYAKCTVLDFWAAR